MKAYGGMGCRVLIIHNLDTRDGDWLATRPGGFAPGEIAVAARWKERLRSQKYCKVEEKYDLVLEKESWFTKKEIGVLLVI
jgi:hypothetical protein